MGLDARFADEWFFEAAQRLFGIFQFAVRALFALSDLGAKSTYLAAKVQSLLQQGRSISLQDLTEQKELSQQIEKCQTAFAQLRKTIRLRNEHLDPFTAIANEIEVTLPTKMQELDQEIAEGPDAWKRAIVSSIATGVAVSAFIYGLISLGKYIA